MSFVPPVFVSHGDPRCARDPDKARDLSDWARRAPRPSAILVVSAHWQAPVATRGSTSARPPLLECAGDLGGVAYAAPGAPELAYDLHTLAPVERAPRRGWDFGVWAPLLHMYPEADVPVLQLSLVAGATARRLYALGRKLGVLAARGVLVMGSGGVTGEVAELAPGADAPPAEWARELDAWFANHVADVEMETLFGWRAKAPHARRAHPTSEHLDPLFVVAGAASLYEHAVGFPVRGFEHGSISRRCIQFGR